MSPTCTTWYASPETSCDPCDRRIVELPEPTAVAGSSVVGAESRDESIEGAVAGPEVGLVRMDRGRGINSSSVHGPRCGDSRSSTGTHREICVRRNAPGYRPRVADGARFVQTEMTVVVLRLLPPCAEHDCEPSAGNLDQAPEGGTRIANRPQRGLRRRCPGRDRRSADDSDHGSAPSPRPPAERRALGGVWARDEGELLRGNLDDLDLAALAHVPASRSRRYPRSATWRADLIWAGSVSTVATNPAQNSRS